MIGGILKLIGGLVVGVVVLGLGIGVLGMLFGLGVALLALTVKLLPLLLVGWVVVKLVQGGERRRSLSSADQRWLDGRR